MSYISNWNNEKCGIFLLDWVLFSYFQTLEYLKINMFLILRFKAIILLYQNAKSFLIINVYVYIYITSICPSDIVLDCVKCENIY